MDLLKQLIKQTNGSVEIECPKFEDKTNPKEYLYCLHNVTPRWLFFFLINVIEIIFTKKKEYDFLIKGIATVIRTSIEVDFLPKDLRMKLANKIKTKNETLYCDLDLLLKKNQTMLLVDGFFRRETTAAKIYMPEDLKCLTGKTFVRELSTPQK